MADKTYIALAGNPNCGKTTLFNELTGSNGYVGNWPGVTVEKKQAPWRSDKDVEFVDLPGIYSLSPYSPEEVVSRDYLVDDRPDATIDLIDVTNLERNLYLTTQILEAGRPVVVGLNMCDLLEERGDKIDTKKLSAKLGVPVIEVSALHNKNLDELVKRAIADGQKNKVATGVKCFTPEVEEALTKIANVISAKCDKNLVRWFSIKVFERDAEAIRPLGLTKDELTALEPFIAKVEKERDDDAESIITSDRYEWIADVMAECVVKAPKKLTTTEKIDKIVTNRVLGLPIFFLVMWVVYYFAVTIGTGPITDWANDGLMGEGWDYFGTFVPGLYGLCAQGLAAVGASEFTTSLILDGIVSGVGAIIGFVPQMIVLFLMLCFLEDCGYMARVAFVMDRVFRKFGLSGKSFIPMLISSGCGVPGVMSTKTIENERDRRMTTMITTFIPCGAKMPIIALLMGALIGGTDASWISPLFYFLGVFAVIISAIMLKKTKLFEGDPAPFVMEMPDYHFPSFRSWMLHVWERIRSYIVKAGTIIFASSALVWFLSNFGVYPGTSFGWLPATSAGAEDFLDYSLLAGLGNAIAWIFAPLGFASWRAAAMTVTGLIAKENVVATFASLSALGEATEEDPAMWQSFAAMFGGNYGPMLAFVAFNLLCAPCFAAMGTIRKQMDDPKWFWAAIGYECGFGWVVGLMIYNFYELAVNGTFTFWTVLAFVAAALLLFQIFRPMPKHEHKDDKILTNLADEVA
ncbi:MAG: ferrous iron transport protein B [Olegusella sp.]|nr:ferrous iron transport protein B [Olegusella sp.]